MATEFTLFVRLPAELRTMIWELCLPSRVVEINHPHWPKLHCGSNWASRHNSLPPAIAHVSSEARGVAEKLALTNKDLDPGNSLLGRFWFQPLKDTIMMYRPDFVLFQEANNDGGLSLQSLKDLEKLARGTAIYFDQTYMWYYPREDWDECHSIQSAPVTGWDDPLLIMYAIPIHATTAQVIASQLFGNFGDECIKLSDPLDSQLMERYRQLCLQSGLPQSASTTDFFHMCAGSPEGVSDMSKMVHTWIGDSKTHELRKRWKAAKANDFIGIPWPENIWVGSDLDDGTSDRPDMDTYGGALAVPPGSIDMNKVRPNEMHPWVRETLASISSFTPRLMFQWCGADC
ncbi:uncharacterized protein N7482_008816 [Penicillium canariense]|uniref:2EXR domain-containing protein n=1 Tax=Penicillium canariense TaxID=189055 RepID=A0A9W9HXB3_9EURO|nr:uncharacterized protein N7482_008816 [Penicillium canariense]KAJ5157716.1 hypothetical protein N7482_008816 [Penicillium canariense]